MRRVYNVSHVMQGKSQFEAALKELNSARKGLDQSRVPGLLIQVNSKRAAYQRLRAEYNRTHSNPLKKDSLLVSEELVKAHDWTHGTSEGQAYFGDDLSPLLKSPPGQFHLPDSAGKRRPAIFREKVAGHTQTIFDIYKQNHSIKSVDTDKKNSLLFGIDATILQGNIISSDLRGKIHESVNDLLFQAEITPGDPATTEAIESELLTLFKERTDQLLIEALNEAFPLDPAGVPLNAATQTAMQSLGLPNPAGAPITLDQIVQKLSEEKFTPESKESKDFFAVLPQKQQESLKNILKVKHSIRADLIKAQAHIDGYNHRLQGAEGKDLRETISARSHFLKIADTLSHTQDTSSIDALLAAQSVSHSIITAPPGKLDSKSIETKLSDTLLALERSSDDPAVEHTRALRLANDTKTVVGTTLQSVSDHLKRKPADHVVMAGILSYEINKYLLEVKQEENFNEKIKNWVQLADPLANDERRENIVIITLNNRDSLGKRYKNEIKDNPDTALVKIATLTALASTMCAIANYEGVSNENAKKISEKLNEYSPTDLTDLRINTIINDEANIIGGISATTKKKLAEAARISLVNSKGMAASIKDAPMKARDEFQQEATKKLPAALALRLAEGITNAYQIKLSLTEAEFKTIYDRILNQAKNEEAVLDKAIDESKEIDLPDSEKKDLKSNLIKQYHAKGKLDDASIQETLKSSKCYITNERLKIFIGNLGLLNNGKVSTEREIPEFKHPSVYMSVHDNQILGRTAVSIYSKVTRSRIVLGVAAAAEAGGATPAEAKAAGEAAADKIQEKQPDSYQEAAKAIQQTLSSTNLIPVIGAISLLEFVAPEERNEAMRESVADSSQKHHKKVIAMAMASAIKSTALKGGLDPAASNSLSINLMTHAQGYLTLEGVPNFDLVFNWNAAYISPNLREAIKINTCAAYAIALGNIAGKAAIDANPPPQPPNTHPTNLRAVASVAAASALTEGLSEDLSLEISAKIAKHYLDNKGVIDFAAVNRIIDEAAVIYPPIHPDPAPTQANKTAIFRTVQAASKITKKGTAHAGTKAAFESVPASASGSLAQKMINVAVIAHLCAGGDTPEKNTVEIGNAIGVAQAGLMASDAHAKKSGALAAASLSASESVFTQLMAPAGGAAPTTLVLLANNPLNVARDPIKLAIRAHLRHADPTVDNLRFCDPIAAAADLAIQKAAGMPGATPPSVAIAASIAVATTGAALLLDPALSAIDAKAIGIAFADLPVGFAPRSPEITAMMMETSYAVARATASVDEIKNINVPIAPVGTVRAAVSAKISADIYDPLGGGLEAKLNSAIQRYDANPSPDHLGKLAVQIQKFINNAARTAEDTFNAGFRRPRELLGENNESLRAALKAEAAAQAAFGISRIPGIPSQIVAIAREKANFYANRARDEEDKVKTRGGAPLRPAIVDLKIIRKLAGSAGIKGLATAKGFIAGRNRGGTPLENAKAGAEASAKVSGASDAEAKAASDVLQLAFEQRTEAVDMGALTGSTLEENQEAAESTAAVSTYFINRAGQLADPQRAQEISQATGAMAARSQRILGDNTNLNDVTAQKKVLQGFSEPDGLHMREKVDKAKEGFEAKEAKEHPAPNLTSMAKDPYIEVKGADPTNAGSWTAKIYTRGVGLRDVTLQEFCPDIARQLTECKSIDGRSYIDMDTARNAVKAFNKKHPESKLKSSDVRSASKGFNIPIKGLDNPQIKELLQCVVDAAKAKMANTKDLNKSVASQPGPRPTL